MLAVDETGAPVDGDQILAVLALGIPEIETVAVTVMTNLGFHRLMDERGIRVLTTDVGDRYVLEALRRENAVLGGEQSGHIVYLVGHDTGDGLVAALLLCSCLGGRPLSEAVAVMPRFPQATENVAVSRGELPQSILDAAASLNDELDGTGRVLVRPSGTEPVVRVLGEAESAEEAERLCASIAALVTRELG
jgi:phosphoglucosamine mutase